MRQIAIANQKCQRRYFDGGKRVTPFQQPCIRYLKDDEVNRIRMNDVDCTASKLNLKGITGLLTPPFVTHVKGIMKIHFISGIAFSSDTTHQL